MDTNGTFCFRFEAFVVLAFSLSRSLSFFLSCLPFSYTHTLRYETMAPVQCVMSHYACYVWMCLYVNCFAISSNGFSTDSSFISTQ